MKTFKIDEICGDYSLTIDYPSDEQQILFFNNRQNAEFVKAVLQWEEKHPNESVPYIDKNYDIPYLYELSNKIKKYIRTYKLRPTGREVTGTIELLEEIYRYILNNQAKKEC